MILESPRRAEPQAASQPREFAGDDVISHAVLANALGVRLRLETEPQRTVRHEWFDTFDWRLHRAGLTLERAAAPRGDRAQLLLRDSGGQLLQAAPVRPAGVTGIGTREAVSLDAVVPAGSLRARLAPVVQMRALLPLAGCRRTGRFPAGPAGAGGADASAPAAGEGHGTGPHLPCG